jgi:hypothetical protein
MSRSEEVFIYLRTIGAAQARRDIDSVAKALGRLNDKQKDDVEFTQAESRALDEASGQRRAHTKTIDSQTSSTNKLTDAEKLRARHIERMSRVNERLSRGSAFTIKDQIKLQRILALESQRAERLRRQELLKTERAAARAARLEEIRQNRITRMYKQHAAKRNVLLKRLNPFTNLPSARRPLRLAVIGSLIFLVADALSLVGTAVNAVGAGAIAAVNGLAPLVGLLGAIPGLYMSLGMAGGVLAMAFGGLVKAISDEKYEDLGPNTTKFAKALNALKPGFDGLRRGVQDVFFQGMGPAITKTSRVLLPLLNKQLDETARRMNHVTRDTLKWIRSKEGIGVLNSVMDSNNIVIGRLSRTASNIGQTLLHIADAAGPMLRLLALDLRRLSDRVLSLVTGNKTSLEGFFLRARDRLLDILSVASKFGRGLYNIFKLAEPLTQHMGKAIAEAADKFAQWTGSKNGAAAISKYFEDMKPNLDAVVGLAGDFFKMLFNISQSPNFVKNIDSIRNDLLPDLERIIREVDGKFLPAMIKVVGAFEKLASAGVIDSLSEIANFFAGMIDRVAEWFAGLSDGEQRVVVWSAVMIGLFGGVASAVFGVVGHVAALIGLLKKLPKGLPLPVVPPAVVPGGKPGAKPKGGLKPGGLGGAVAVTGGIAAADSVGRGADALRKGGQGDVALGNFTPFFRRGGGKGDLVMGVNDLDSALGALAKNPWHMKVNDWAAKMIGAKGPTVALKDAFGGIDTQLTQLPGAQAAQKFNMIKTAAEKQKIPVDQLVSLFPQYRDKVASAAGGTGKTASAMKNAAGAANVMAGKVGDASNKLSAYERKKPGPKKLTVTTNAAQTANSAQASMNSVQNVTRTITIRKNTYQANFGGGTARSTGAEDKPPRFAGGPVLAGKTYMTGELGPELALSRSGMMSMVGLGGPELFKPNQDMAIVPSSASFNPMSGDYGNTPDWAKNMLQNAIASNKPHMGIPGNREPKGGSNRTPINAEFKISSDNPTGVKQAVKQALRELMREQAREQRERRI